MFQLYADLLFGLPLAESYTYRVTEYLRSRIAPGMRVETTLQDRIVTGVVHRLHQSAPDCQLVALEKLLDPYPLVTADQFSLAFWMADYYLCSPGEALFKMFPKATPSRRALKSPPVVGQSRSGAGNRERGGRDRGDGQGSQAPKFLYPEQQRVYRAIAGGGRSLQKLSGGRPSSELIHGVTGSGKTEIYIHLIRDALERGQGAILLVPEISLTVQMIGRLRAVFGEELALLHSALKPRQRLENYLRLLHAESSIAVGTRSAVFAPLQSLGVIIIDEEHDPSYKEQSSPRYDARQIAHRRALDEGALLIFGSATPRIESAYFARSSLQNFSYHRIGARPSGASLPSVELAEISNSNVVISAAMLQALEQNLKRGEQSILLLNRRGYHTSLYCHESRQAELCPFCSVSLSLHQQDRLLCHYCGYSRTFTGTGSDGGAVSLLGAGTQRLEELLLKRLPSARIERLDTDAASRRGVVQQVIQRFLEGEIDILVGTQMIAKGLDAGRVTFVGVLQIEAGLHLPDFRASERAFSLLLQVAGRAGRQARPGRVILECLDPHNPLLQQAARQDYEAFYQSEILARKKAFYPPFSRLVRLLCRGKGEQAVREAADQLAAALSQGLAKLQWGEEQLQLLGPVAAPLEKLQGQYRYHLIIKTASLAPIRRLLAAQFPLQERWRPGEVYLEIDFDPVDML